MPLSLEVLALASPASARPLLIAVLAMVVAGVVLQVVTRLMWLALGPILDAGLAGLVVTIALPFLLGTAAGGALAVRLRGIAWPGLTAAALLNAVVILGVVWLAVPGQSPARFGQYPGVWWDQVKAALPILTVASAGVFALPLADPVVRRSGPAPTVWKVLLTAAGTVIGLVLLFSLISPSGAHPGLAALILATFVGALLVGTGLLLSLAGHSRPGAWVGALGLMTAILGLIVWVLTGREWFP